MIRIWVNNIVYNRIANWSILKYGWKFRYLYDDALKLLGIQYGCRRLRWISFLFLNKEYD